jgi:regulator of protease activity HflC (stomatin/prohibitin superfamily)
MADTAVVVILFIVLVLYFTSPVVQSFINYSILIIIGLACVYLFFRWFVKKYDEYERGIIFRMGKMSRVAGPGWSIVIPFFEKEFKRIDVRTHMVNLNIPTVFTADDLRLHVDGMAYYKVTNPSKAVLEIDNYLEGLSNLMVSETRNVIAKLSMRDLFSGLDNLNQLVIDAIRHQTWKWGINITTLQIKSIQPPVEIAVAMQQKEIEAQQLQAQRFRAEAKRVMIEAIGEAAEKLNDKAVMYLYIKALEEMGKGQATKVIFPMQFFDVLQGMGGDVKAAMAGAGLANVSIDELVGTIKNKIGASP